MEWECTIISFAATDDPLAPDSKLARYKSAGWHVRNIHVSPLSGRVVYALTRAC